MSQSPTMASLSTSKPSTSGSFSTPPSHLRPHRAHRPLNPPAALPLSDAPTIADALSHHLLLLDLAAPTTSAPPEALDELPKALQLGGDFIKPFADSLETTLAFIQANLEKAGVPYSYGWSVIILTFGVKVLTLPILKKQADSALASQALKPQIDALKKRYGDDKETIQKETSILYEEAGVDPLAGCLPSLASVPIFWALYRSLSTVRDLGLYSSQSTTTRTAATRWSPLLLLLRIHHFGVLFTAHHHHHHHRPSSSLLLLFLPTSQAAYRGELSDGFYWIPTLSGPTSVTNRGTSWLFPFVDGAPPIGWHDAGAYLVLPALLLVVQYGSQALTPIDPNDEAAQKTAWLTKALPLLLGWFSLNVPSGLALYYVTNVSLTIAVMYVLKKGEADIIAPEAVAGTARRTGSTAAERPEGAVVVGEDIDNWGRPMKKGEEAAAAAAASATNLAMTEGETAGLAGGAVVPVELTPAEMVASMSPSMRCKRPVAVPRPGQLGGQLD